MIENNPTLTLALIKHVYIFYVCAKHLNFTQAGQELFLTQSAISKSIKKLETSLEKKLFNRNKNHINLSPEGKIFFENISYLCFDLSKQITNTANNNNNNTIVFHTIPSCANYWLNKITDEFSQKHQNFKIRVNIYNTAFVKEMLEHDITICCLKDVSNFSEDHLVIKLFDEDLIPICSPNLLKQYSDTEALINNSNLIVHSSRENFWHDILPEFNISFDSSHSRLELEHFYMIIEAVLQGKGIGLSPRKYVSTYIENQSLTIPFKTKFTSPYSYYLCAHKNNLNKSCNLKFINWYKNTYNPD